MMWLLFEAVIRYVLVTLQNSFLLLVSLVRRVISLHLETKEEKSWFVFHI